MTDINDDKDLIIVALKQRIGAITSQYEYEMATIRAQYTKLEHAYTTLTKSLSESSEKKTPKTQNLTVEDLIGESKDNV